MTDNRPLSEQFRVVAKQWADADAAARLLEETKTATLSEWKLKQGDIPDTHAEKLVKASPEWRDFITAMTDARSKANLLKVQLEYIRMRFSEWQSAEANKRAEMKL